MQTFIKQNWFKLGILVIFGSAVLAFIQINNKNAVPIASIVPVGSSTSTAEVQNPPIQTVPAIKIKTGTTSTVPVTKAISIPLTQPTWHTAFTYAGESSTDSASFRMRGSHWRVTYSCAATGQYPGVQVVITGEDSDNIGQSESFGSSVDNCPPNHVYDFYNHTPGLYSFHASDGNASYTISIEDYY